ncbi:MAG: PAS domain S-box protein [Desulfovibrionaceae bacterium]
MPLPAAGDIFMVNPRLTALAGALPRLLHGIRCSLITKLALVSGSALMLFFFLWSSLNIGAMKTLATEATMSDMDRLGNTINLGLHYAMLTYSPQSIREIIKNIGTQQGILSIRVYNKKGEIKYSNLLSEIDETTDIKQEACYVCHRTTPPQTNLALAQRTRFFTDSSGHPCLGILRPIVNEPSCAGDPCHVHPADKKILGLLDITVSQAASEAKLARYTEMNFLAALAVAGATFCILFLFTHLLVNRPVRRMIRATRAIAAGQEFTGTHVTQSDEMGELGRAIDTMGREVLTKQAELERQKERYRDLFEHVPCTITVQDKNLRLLSYNQVFADEFHATPGAYCYKVYKGRTAPCPNCPVIRSFEDGLPHATEEITLDKDGSPRNFYVSTSPMTDEAGRVTSVMEISLDITDSKFLEEELERSRKKYQAIFSCIPSALFVLDRDDLTILECNPRPRGLYGYEPGELLGQSFLSLFDEPDTTPFEAAIRAERPIDRVRHRRKNGQSFYAAIRVSTAEYPGSRVYLASVTDITSRLETEQQLIQASKMATLGEMSTSVAHELNQPMTVIQTIADYLRRKLRRGQLPDQAGLTEMAEGVSRHIARATGIINHMREFGRKNGLTREPVDLATVIRRTFELFSQQLAVRNITVDFDLPDGLPQVLAQPNPLEQVFMNLLLNARDAVEEHWGPAARPGDKRITISTRVEEGRVVATVADNGPGIAPEVLGRIFEPFFTTKEVGKGTGLGLSISYNIVKDYGGDIVAASEPGQGARFHVRLPVWPDTAA